MSSQRPPPLRRSAPAMQDGIPPPSLSSHPVGETATRPRSRGDGGMLPPQLPLNGTASNDLPPPQHHPMGIPSSPPPSYEQVLAENRLVAAAQMVRAASLDTATSGSSSSAGACGGSSSSGGAGGGSTSGARAGKSSGAAPLTVRSYSMGADTGRSTLPGRGPALEIQHKSSKELYRAVAAQWGLTCKMSDKCRCFDCQGRYFDCGFEPLDPDKADGRTNASDLGDGGLGAGTPMFISEVMGGSACTLL